jgi:hypothetical protein
MVNVPAGVLLLQCVSVGQGHINSWDRRADEERVRGHLDPHLASVECRVELGAYDDALP